MQATPLENLGRDYLCKQVNHPKNPWKKALEEVSKTSEIASSNFKSQLNSSDLRKCVIETPGTCDAIRQSALHKSIRHHPSLTLEELHPIFTFLKSKAKYAKADKKYQEQDERRVLTARLDKLLRKLASGKMLTKEEKIQKQSKTCASSLS